MPLGFSQDDRPRRRSSTQVQPLGEETLLYLEDEGQVGLLNATAYFIWQLCDGQHTVGDMVAALAEHFAGTDLHDLQADTQQVLIKLQEGGLLEAGPAQASQ